MFKFILNLIVVLNRRDDRARIMAARRGAHQWRIVRIMVRHLMGKI